MARPLGGVYATARQWSGERLHYPQSGFRRVHSTIAVHGKIPQAAPGRPNAVNGGALRLQLVRIVVRAVSKGDGEPGSRTNMDGSRLRAY